VEASQTAANPQIATTQANVLAVAAGETLTAETVVAMGQTETHHHHPQEDAERAAETEVDRGATALDRTARMPDPPTTTLIMNKQGDEEGTKSPMR